MIAIKLCALLILFIPTLIVTTLIWIFGGWTKGWNYMPNPLWELIGWVID